MLNTTAQLKDILHAIDLWETDRDRIQDILEHPETAVPPLDPQGRELLLQELVVSQSQIDYLREIEGEMARRAT